MLISRFLVALVLVPIGLALIVFGGIPYLLMVALLMSLAAWEYQRLFRAGGLRPAGALLILGALLIVVGRALDGFNSFPWIVSLLILSSMTYHLVAYECGRDQAATDLGVTITGALYIGWLGAYLISLRALPEGVWWLLIVLPGVWLADVGAYLIGSRLGRHKLSPRLSPKKTWEGFFGGVLAGTLGSALLAAVLQAWTGPVSAITLERGAVLGFLLASITPLGDLGESMIKRQVGMKDSSHILPGHGGIFDRIDTWLWAGVIGYYVIVWFFI
jgi:phosphatidate cytidylyltransferase